MTAGDVTSVIIAVPHTTTTINAAIAGLRVGANDKWLITSIGNQIIVINIEET